ncbi:MAG: VWA domain-containing protein, partial [Acidobacteria bacterium]|nr:VWA domain-containing protein [Acidobacteriota bacterium]
MRRAITLFLLSVAALPQVRFELSTDLIVVDVQVRDRDGKPIEGLKKEDFTILEDGKPQTISIFEFQRLTLAPLPASPSVSVPASPVRLPASPPVRREPAAPARVIRYQDRRLLVLFFDFSAMPPTDQIRAQEAALKFLDQKMTAADLVSVMTFSTRLQVVQDFTDDRETLTKTIK